MKPRMFILMLSFSFILMAVLSYQATAGCGKWVIRDNTDYLEDPLFDALADSGSSGPNASSSDTAAVKSSDIGSKEISTSASTAASTQGNGQKALVSKLDLSGKWSLKMNGSFKTNDSSFASGDRQRIMDIILVQSGSRVQGYGSFTENSTVVTVTATGSLNNDVLKLDIRPVTEGKVRKVDKLYKLSLEAIGKALIGRYEFYLSDELIGRGNATASN